MYKQQKKTNYNPTTSNQQQTTSNDPLVTVLMSVFNEEKYLSEAIESILNQTYKKFEFLIIDDGSNNRTTEILKKYSFKDSRIRIIRNKINLGLTKSLNLGIIKAKGMYIARMDSDDISFSERIKKQVYFLEKNLDIVVCGSRVKKLNNCHKTEYSKEVTISNEIKVALFFQNTLSHPSVMIRKKVLDKNNYKYNESFKTTQDYELWSRIADRHKLANLSEVLLSYRQHKENISTKNQFEQMNNAFLVRKNLAEKLMDRPLTNKEIALHKVLTDPKISDIVVPMELMLEWIIMLYRRNQQTALYNKYYFRKHLTFAWKTYLKKMSKYNLRLMGPGVSLILKRNFKCSNLFFIIKLISWCVWY